MKPLGPTELKRLHRSWRRKTAHDMAVICDGVQQPFNVGSIMRSAAAYGIKHLWLVPPTADPSSPKVQVTAKGCDRFLQIERAESGADAVAAAKALGYQVVAIELTAEAKPIFEVDLNGGPVAIVVGHEERGVHRDTLAAVDLTVFLPLVGNVGSLNVGHTATAALAELRRQGWS
ncbi:MAG: TrmH family RNA methyltransferase [Acidimicrobiales bacterium]|nr:TrmH family RNA methyltransferase [Acidimicrobiales bacterium]